MKLSILPLASLALTTTIASAQIAQDWLRVRHRFFPQSILREASGYYIVVGTEYDAVQQPYTAFTDAAVLRYTPTGQLISAWSSDVPNTEYVRTAALDPQGNIVIVMQVGAGHLYQTAETWRVAKYSVNGQLLWSHDFIGRYLNTADPYALAIDSEGNIYVAGTDYQIGNERDFTVLKYSPSGQVLWEFHLGGPMWDTPNSIQVRGDGVYVVGHTAFDGPEAALVKINAQSGEQEWLRTWSAPGPLVMAAEIAFDMQDNVYITGIAEYYQTTSQDILVSKVSPAGEVLWTVTHDYDTHWYDRATEILVAPDGSVYVAGGTFQNFGEAYYDMALVKYDSNGSLQWATKWGSPILFTNNESEEEAAGLFIDDAGFIYSISSDWTQPGFDIIVTKHNSNGELIEAFTVDTPNGWYEFQGAFDFNPATRKLAITAPGGGFGGGMNYIAATTVLDLGIAVIPICNDIDFNNDGSLFDPQDIEAFLSVYSEGPCVPLSATCDDIDFNNDTSVFDPCDIGSFLLAFSEGPCTSCGQ